MIADVDASVLLGIHVIRQPNALATARTRTETKTTRSGLLCTSPSHFKTTLHKLRTVRQRAGIFPVFWDFYRAARG